MINKSITYVLAKPEDAEFLTQFAMDSNNIYRYRTVADEEARKVFLLKKEDFAISLVVIMKIAEVIIGFYSLKNYELAHLFLDPNYIRKGYGTLLFKKAMTNARELGWKEIKWESDPNATKFYEKMGAEQIGKSPCKLNPSYECSIFRYQL